VSYTKHAYHIIFATKQRRPFIDATLRGDLCSYVAGIIRQCGGTPLKINGPVDHIHIAAIIPPTIAIAELVRNIKSASSKWIHKTAPDRQAFKWQDGYMSVTVSHSAIPQVVEYVAEQLEHHRAMSFDDELRLILKKHEIDFDERYLGG